MILEILTWGFFSAWGWFGANYIKERIWPPDPPAVERKVDDNSTGKNAVLDPQKGS